MAKKVKFGLEGQACPKCGKLIKKLRRHADRCDERLVKK